MSKSAEENIKVILNNRKVGRLLVILGLACSFLSLLEGVFASTPIYRFCGFGLCFLFIAFAAFSFFYTSQQRIEYTKDVICIKTWKKEDEINILDLNTININVTNYNGHSISNWSFITQDNGFYQIEMDYDLNSREVKNMINDIQSFNPKIELSYCENEYKTEYCY